MHEAPHGISGIAVAVTIALTVQTRFSLLAHLEQTGISNSCKIHSWATCVSHQRTVKDGREVKGDPIYQKQAARTGNFTDLLSEKPDLSLAHAFLNPRVP